VILVSKTYWAGAPWSFRERPREAGLESVELRADDFRRFRALYWTPAGVPRPRVAVVCMHPRVDFTHHYCIPRLLAAGIGVLGANTRNPNNDLTTVHEEIVLDVAAAVKWLRAHRGAERVVLLGNSGGGSLSALFQAQAVRPAAERLAITPGGAPTRLRQADLIPADGMVYLSAHKGQGRIMNECIDPAVIDEADPRATDASLDMYDAGNGFRPPPEWSAYDPPFVTRYRAAQIERVRRLDATAHALIAERTAAVAESEQSGFADRPFVDRQAVERAMCTEPVMVVYRTMANLHYTDNHLDPSPREYGSLVSERPDLMNRQVLGFGRVCTPEAWLSTWSGLSSNADLVANVRAIPQPTLVVNAGCDKEIYPTVDARPIFEAVASADKTFHELPNARHYFEPEFGARTAPDVEAVMDLVVPWVLERFSSSTQLRG
jgi:acetyl esterase/lipase